ncbi:MAG: VanW family protein [Clostridium sp.]|nr:VanW family protein [Clostridium sp.]
MGGSYRVRFLGLIMVCPIVFLVACKNLGGAQDGMHINKVREEIQTQPEEEPKGSLIEISTFSTQLLDEEENRIKNLSLAADILNDEKIPSGAEFSFNETLGRRTKEKGYKEAPIIKNTEKGPQKALGVGGGICQLSSTLYNAAEGAGLEITERHQHSKNVGYVQEGKDATVVYGSQDFKFKNNQTYSIIIKAEVSSKEVSIKLLKVED